MVSVRWFPAQSSLVRSFVPRPSYVLVASLHASIPSLVLMCMLRPNHVCILASCCVCFSSAAWSRHDALVGTFGFATTSYLSFHLAELQLGFEVQAEQSVFGEFPFLPPFDAVSYFVCIGGVFCTDVQVEPHVFGKVPFAQLGTCGDVSFFGV